MRAVLGRPYALDVLTGSRLRRLIAGRARVGLADFATDSFDIPLAKDARISAFQDDAEHFSVMSDGLELKSGNEHETHSKIP